MASVSKSMRGPHLLVTPPAEFTLAKMFRASKPEPCNVGGGPRLAIAATIRKRRDLPLHDKRPLGEFRHAQDDRNGKRRRAERPTCNWNTTYAPGKMTQHPVRRTTPCREAPRQSGRLQSETPRLWFRDSSVSRKSSNCCFWASERELNLLVTLEAWPSVTGDGVLHGERQTVVHQAVGLLSCSRKSWTKRPGFAVLPLILGKVLKSVSGRGG